MKFGRTPIRDKNNESAYRDAERYMAFREAEIFSEKYFNPDDLTKMLYSPRSDEDQLQLWRDKIENGAIAEMVKTLVFDCADPRLSIAQARRQFEEIYELLTKTRSENG